MEILIAVLVLVVIIFLIFTAKDKNPKVFNTADAQESKSTLPKKTSHRPGPAQKSTSIQPQKTFVTLPNHREVIEAADEPGFNSTFKFPLAGSHLAKTKSFFRDFGFNSMPVSIVPEPGNKYNPEALAIFYDNTNIGYVPDNKLKGVKKILAVVPNNCYVHNIAWNDAHQGNYEYLDVTIGIDYYKPEDNNADKSDEIPTIGQPKTPFEAAIKVINLRNDERESGRFDYGMYKQCMRLMESDTSIKLAEKEINSRDIIGALEWYYEFSAFYRFPFKAETKTLMQGRINQELDEAAISGASSVDEIILTIDYLEFSLSDSLRNMALEMVYNSQKEIIFPELLALTPVKAARKLNAFSKDHALFSPKLAALKTEIENITGHEEILKELGRLQSRASKAKDKPEKLAGLQADIEAERLKLRALIQNKIDLIFT